jgi:sugar/nucleoside kinase (ribokinase family)
MNNSQSAAVLGAGTAIVDLLVRVDDDFLAQELPDGRGNTTWVEAARLDELIRRLHERGFQPEKAPGGSTGNLLCGLSELGLETRFLGWLGLDNDGVYYRDTFAESGGNTRSFKYHPSKHTGRCLSLVSPDADRSMVTDLGASAEMRANEIHVSDLEGVSLLHTEGYLCGLNDRTFLPRLFEQAKNAGIPVSFDLASYGIVREYRDGIRDDLGKYVDIVFANELEAAEFAGTGDPESMLDALAELCPVAAVKLGALGSIVRMDGRTVRVAPEPANPVDATGAGDLWQAGFLFGWLHHAAPEVCGRIGSILGAAAVSNFGARLPEDRWHELRERIRSMI